MRRISVGPICLFLCMFLIACVIFSLSVHAYVPALLAKLFSKRIDVQLLICFVFSARTERLEDWVPEEVASCKHDKSVSNEYSDILEVGDDEHKALVDIFSIHSGEGNQLLKAVYLDTVFL